MSIVEDGRGLAVARYAASDGHGAYRGTLDRAAKRPAIEVKGHGESTEFRVLLSKGHRAKPVRAVAQAMAFSHSEMDRGRGVTFSAKLAGLGTVSLVPQ